MIPSLTCLGVIMILTSIGFTALSRRSTKAFYVQARCEDVSFTKELTFFVDPSVDSLHLMNFAGTFTNIDVTQLSPTAPAIDSALQLRLRPSSDDPTGAPPSVRLNRKGPSAPLTIHARAPVSLQTVDLPRDSDSVNLALSAGSGVTMQAEELHVEASRYTVEGLPHSQDNQAAASAPFVITNTISPLQGDFTAPAAANSKEPARISLFYPNKTDRLALLGRSGKTIPLGRVDLNLSGCSSTVLQIQDAADLVLHAYKSHIKLEGSELMLHQLHVTTGNEPAGREIAIEAAGISQSIIQEQKQLIPTVLADILNRKPYETGLLGAGLVFCVFAIGIFLKRSLEVIAKRMIPD